MKFGSIYMRKSWGKLVGEVRKVCGCTPSLFHAARFTTLHGVYKQGSLSALCTSFVLKFSTYKIYIFTPVEYRLLPTIHSTNNKLQQVLFNIYCNSYRSPV